MTLRRQFYMNDLVISLGIGPKSLPVAGNTLTERHSLAQGRLLRLFRVQHSLFLSFFLFSERGRWCEGTRPAG